MDEPKLDEVDDGEACTELLFVELEVSVEVKEDVGLELEADEAVEAEPEDVVDNEYKEDLVEESPTMVVLDKPEELEITGELKLDVVLKLFWLEVLLKEVEFNKLEEL